MHLQTRIRKARLGTFIAIFIAVIMTTTGSVALARTLITNNAVGRTIIHRQTDPALQGKTPVGALAGDQTLHLTLALAPRNGGGLDALLAAQNNRESPFYHHYLSPSQYVAQFGPTQSTLSALTNFITQQGLHLGKISANHLGIDVTGNAAAVEHAFAIHLMTYNLDSHVVYAPDGDPSVPQNLASSIQSIIGLDDIAELKQVTTPSTPPLHAATVKPKTTGGPGGGLAPADLQKAYDITPLITAGYDGTGKTIGLMTEFNYDLSEITTFRSYYGMGPANITNIYRNGASASDPAGSNPQMAVQLDGIFDAAPNVAIKVYVYGPATTQQYLDVWQSLVNDAAVNVIMGDKYACETDQNSYFATGEITALDTIFKQAAAQGQAIVAPSGDGGAYACPPLEAGQQGALGVTFPASDPYVIGVGGSMLTLNADGTYQSEVVWNHSYLPMHTSASGGGYSTLFPRPAYQTGLGVDVAPAAMRQVPDVSAMADVTNPGDSGYAYYCIYSFTYCPGWGTVLGTASGAALWAGIIADLDQFLTVLGSPNAVINNAELYTLFNKPTPSFHDITQGNNELYPATPGYDKATGIGTPDVWQMALHAEVNGDTPGVYRSSNSTFYLRNSLTTGFADETISFGVPGDLPVAGDWDSMGIDGIGVFRPSTATFYLTDANTPGAPITHTLTLGIAGDIPIVGDWTHSGHDSVGVFRPSNGLIYLRNSLTTGFADFTMVLGLPGDIPVAGDWNGDGSDSPGVYRPSTTQFYLTNKVCNCSAIADYTVGLGVKGDVPFAGDWTNSGRTGIGVFRPSNGLIYMRNDPTTSGFANYSLVLGIPNDLPIAGHWIKR